MVKKMGVEMDNNGNLTDQLKSAIKRRDVTTVERILKMAAKSQRTPKKRRHSKDKQQVLLTLARMVNKEREKAI